MVNEAQSLKEYIFLLEVSVLNSNLTTVCKPLHSASDRFYHSQFSRSLWVGITNYYNP